MSKNNSIRKAFYHLRMAKIYFEDTVRESPNSIAGKSGKTYAAKIDWIERDFATHPKLPADAIDDFKTDINGDIMFYEELSQKALELTESNKNSLLKAIDMIIAGEEITMEIR